MIYFDDLKKAYANKIDNVYGTDTDEKWAEFCTLTLGADYDIKEGENCIVDLRQTPEYIAEKLAKAKTEKIAETETKLDEKRYNFVLTVTLQDKECVFDTNKKTQDDLQTAAIFTSNGGVYPNWVTNNGITLDLTAEDIRTVFNAIFPLVSPLYTKQLQYIEQIEQAETLEELNAIIIDYNEVNE